jgi:hypothetical protein
MGKAIKEEAGWVLRLEGGRAEWLLIKKVT